MGMPTASGGEAGEGPVVAAAAGRQGRGRNSRQPRGGRGGRGPRAGGGEPGDDRGEAVEGSSGAVLGNPLACRRQRRTRAAAGTQWKGLSEERNGVRSVFFPFLQMRSLQKFFFYMEQPAIPLLIRHSYIADHQQTYINRGSLSQQRKRVRLA